LHGGDAMVEAIRDRFRIVSSERCAYLYSYFGGGLEENARGYNLAQALLQIEQRRITEGSLAATGLRIVATPKP